MLAGIAGAGIAGVVALPGAFIDGTRIFLAFPPTLLPPLPLTLDDDKAREATRQLAGLGYNTAIPHALKDGMTDLLGRLEDKTNAPVRTRVRCSILRAN